MLLWKRGDKWQQGSRAGAEPVLDLSEPAAFWQDWRTVRCSSRLEVWPFFSLYFLVWGLCCFVFFIIFIFKFNCFSRIWLRVLLFSATPPTKFLTCTHQWKCKGARPGQKTAEAACVRLPKNSTVCDKSQSRERQGESESDSERIKRGLRS